MSLHIKKLEERLLLTRSWSWACLVYYRNKTLNTINLEFNRNYTNKINSIPSLVANSGRTFYAAIKQDVPELITFNSIVCKYVWIPVSDIQKFVKTRRSCERLFLITSNHNFDISYACQNIEFRCFDIF